MLCNRFPTQSLTYILRTQNDFLRGSASTSQYSLNSLRCFKDMGHDFIGHKKFKFYQEFQKKNQKVIYTQSRLC